MFEGFYEGGLVHPVEGMHAAEVGGGVDFAPEFQADGGGFLGEGGDALGSAELQAMPVEWL